MDVKADRAAAGTFREGVRNLSPPYFALVMATGIVSIAMHLFGVPMLAWGLFGFNIVAFTVLFVLNLLRLIWFPRTVLADLFDHKRSLGFFTSVASCCVLGSQFVRIANDHAIGLAMLILGIVLWAVLTYSIFTALTIKEEKPTLDQGITGAWLLAVVATQSVAVLSALLAPHYGQPSRLELNFLALSMWLCGGMLYIWMISLIFYRYTFFKFSPGDLAPPYWINMGAMAISTLAGAVLISNSGDAPYLQSVLSFLKGFTVFYWATGTWWIPMLFILATWRYGFKRFPFRYDPLYWGAVFPLGMYTVATHQMAKAMDLPFLDPIPQTFVYIALAAWILVFMGMMTSLVRTWGLTVRGRK